MKKCHTGMQIVVTLRRAGLVLNGQTIWLRAFLETCFARRPWGVAVATIADVAKVTMLHHRASPLHRGVLPGSV